MMILLVSFRIRSSVRWVLQDNANFGFGGEGLPAEFTIKPDRIIRSLAELPPEGG
jgi:hypothetical protein